MSLIPEDSLLKKAIKAAVNDRESFIGAVRHSQWLVAQASNERSQLLALRGKRLSAMTADELKTAMLAFFYGERGEARVAREKPMTPVGRSAATAAARFREVRLRRWGKTWIENYLDDIEMPGYPSGAPIPL